MKILIYKRTHKGDPDERGIFGINDCMGRIRDYDYDAVIGIGGKAPWNDDQDIKYKVNWVGLEPKWINAEGKRADCVVFSHFELYEEKGMDIEENFPNLFRYMYDTQKRFEISSELPGDVLEEVQQILKFVEKSKPSKEYSIEKIELDNNDELSRSAKCKCRVKGELKEVCVEIKEIC